MSSVVQRESIINAMVSYHCMLVDMTKDESQVPTLEELGQWVSNMKLLIKQEREDEQLAKATTMP